MRKIELIITCENCGHVEHLEVDDENESTRRIDKFACPGHCSPNYYSYITSEDISVGVLMMEQIAHVA